MQRVRVGMTGLATVLLVILLVSALFTSAHREQPVAAVGAPNANVVADIAESNSASGKPGGPLAQLGVEPSTTVPYANASAAH